MTALRPSPIRAGFNDTGAVWYSELQGALGSAYFQQDGTLAPIIQVFVLAITRQLAAVDGTITKLENQATPMLAFDSLRQWADILGVSVSPDDKPHEIRAKCLAKYRAAQGPTISVVENSLETILGNAFVQVTTADPDGYYTYWPVINPGLPANNLGETADEGVGDGTWQSINACHLVIQVTQPSSLNDDDFLYLLNVDMFNLLDVLLPAWVTWDWCINDPEDGFILGSDSQESTLDFYAL
jgi:hypothetical protein